MWKLPSPVTQMFSKRVIRQNYKYSTSILPKDLNNNNWKLIEKNYSAGTEIENFVVIRQELIKEFDSVAIQLRHLKTGAQYLHLTRHDNNNAFGIGFRTTPHDSTGVPHILEHITLCGSQKFPCRDPFLKMLNRSMATYMNALTAPDYTVYPFSTQNRIDYSNLMSIYLDAVFKPNLKETDFRQEGWRLEHLDATDQTTPIVIKGVVYNEMKGALAEIQSLFGESLLNNILPSHTYGVISGGDPAIIPRLTYTDLKTFHKKFYHPSNSRIYSYGNFPLKDHLHFLNKVYLEEYQEMDECSKLSEVPSEPRWDNERNIHVTCRADSLAPNQKKQSTIAISNLCNDIKDIQETFVLQLLTELLVKGPNSSFYKSLIEPNIGGGFSPVTGFDAQTRDTIFSVGLQGVDPADFEKIVSLYDKTIEKVIEKGFDENNIKAVLHNIELHIKHQMSDFGLAMLFGIMPLWNHDGDIIKAMKVNDNIAEFMRNRANNPHYLQDLVVKYFRDNKHRLILTMSPDTNYEKGVQEKENNLLREKIDELSNQQRENIYQSGLQLMKEQESKQDVSCLPTLSISDLNLDVERVSIKGILVQEVPVQICTAFTNGLTYLRGVINSSVLSDEAKSLLPLFCNVMTRMGTLNKDYRQMDQLIQLHTGGLSFNTHIAENIYDCNSYEEAIIFSSFCLDQNVDVMMSLWTQLFNEVNLKNKKRFETIVNIQASNLINGIVDSAHHYAMSAAGSLISASALCKEKFAGLTYIEQIKEISQYSDLSDILELMENIGEIILNKRDFRVALNLLPENEEYVLPHTKEFLWNVKGKFKHPFVLSNGKSGTPQKVGVHHVFNFPGNFTALCIPTIHYMHKDFPALRVMAKLLTSKYLLPRIREKGGAYGTGCNVSTHGNMLFFSYRDPNPICSFNIFDDAKEWLTKKEFSEQDVDEAKLGVFQSIDAPIPPGNKGIRNFLYGISDDDLQSHRKMLMKIKKEDILRVTKYLISDTEGRCLLGPENSELVKRTNENWITKKYNF